MQNAERFDPCLRGKKKKKQISIWNMKEGK
jgi:hypothetical protein